MAKIPPFDMPHPFQLPPDFADLLRKILGVPQNMEPWVKTKTDDGKVYYWHAVTRQSSWVKPSNGVIFAHSELLERIVKAEQKGLMKRNEFPIIAMPQFMTNSGQPYQHPINFTNVPHHNGYEQDLGGSTPIGEEFIKRNIGGPAEKDLHLRRHSHQLAYENRVNPSINAEKVILDHPSN